MLNNLIAMKFKIITLIMAALLMLTGCATDSDVKGRHIDYGRLQLGRMDLKGAVSLGLKSESGQTRAIEGEYLSAGLYKIDAEGNISAVVVYFTTDTAGNRLEHEEMLRVVPSQLYNLTDNYLLVSNCEYYDSDGEFVSDKWINDYSELIRQEVPYKNLLVRKTDGKIWCIDNIKETLLDYYGKLKGAFYERLDGVVFFCNGYVFKFNLKSEIPSFEQITASIKLSPSSFAVSDNDVPWSFSSKNLTIAWPHAGYTEFNRSSLEKLVCNYFNDFPIKDIVLAHYTGLTLESKSFNYEFCKNGNKLGVLVLPRGILTAVNNSGHKENIPFKSFSDIELGYIKEEVLRKWDMAFYFDIHIGDNEESISLSEPAKLRNVPLLNTTNSNDFEVNISSTLLSNNYLLAIDVNNKIIELDFSTREWKYIKQLTFSVDLSTSDLLGGKIWTIIDTQDNFGAYWFDPVSFEDGFVKFNVQLPSYVSFQRYSSSKEMLIYSGMNPSTGNTEQYVIDIQTGETITSVTEQTFMFEELISLN